VCSELQYEAVPLSPTTDRRCHALDSCKLEIHYEAAGLVTGGNRGCLAARACDFTREYAAVGWTPLSDRVCAPYSVCGPGEFQSRPPTLSSDRLCQPLRVCGPGEFRAVAATPSSDTVCQSLAVCGPNEFEAAAPTTTSNRRCKLVTLCAGSLVEVAAPTTSSDRLCASSNAVAAEASPVPGFLLPRAAAMTGATLSLLEGVVTAAACGSLCEARGTTCAAFTHSAQFRSCLLLAGLEAEEPVAAILDFLYYERHQTTTTTPTTSTPSSTTATFTMPVALTTDAGDASAVSQLYHDALPGSTAVASLNVMHRLLLARQADVAYDTATPGACERLCNLSQRQLLVPCVAFEHSSSLRICVLLGYHLPGPAGTAGGFSRYVRRVVAVDQYLRDVAAPVRYATLPAGGMVVPGGRQSPVEATARVLSISMRVRQTPDSKGYLLAKANPDGTLRYYALYLTRAAAGQQLWFYYLPQGRAKHRVVKLDMPGSPTVYGKSACAMQTAMDETAVLTCGLSTVVMAIVSSFPLRICRC